MEYIISLGCAIYTNYLVKPISATMGPNYASFKSIWQFLSEPIIIFDSLLIFNLNTFSFKTPDKNFI